jgi:AraC-like DNA-binding protein
MVKSVRVPAREYWGYSDSDRAALIATIYDRVRLDEANQEFGSKITRAGLLIARLALVLEDYPDLPLTLTDVAGLLLLERTYCCRVFQQQTGMSFSGWLRKIRIGKAKKLLRVPGNSITAVSHAVGYSDVTTFERNFRKELGLSPSTYRQGKADDATSA